MSRRFGLKCAKVIVLLSVLMALLTSCGENDKNYYEPMNIECSEEYDNEGYGGATINI